MTSRYFKPLNPVWLLILLSILILLSSSSRGNTGVTSAPVQAAGLYPEITALQSVNVPHQEIVSCDDPDAQTRCVDGTCSTSPPDEFGTCSFHGGVLGPIDSTELTPTPQPQFSEPTPTPTRTPTPNPLTPTPIPSLRLGPEIDPGDNLVFNGSFEFGFYQVPELGFEPPDAGSLPNEWNWFKSNTYGKYNIYNNQALGLICPDDLDEEASGKNSLSIHVQSTDQQDARLGIYQTVDVVEGQEYLFYMAGVMQVQSGGSSPDKNHHVLLYFDQDGGTDWRSIPHENWTRVGWREQELEFKISGPDDPDLAVIEDYYEVVKPRSDKLTIFIMAWRRWANWRTGIYTVDCVTLVPVNKVKNLAAIVPTFSQISTTVVDEALAAAAVEAPAQPAPEAQPAAAEPATEPAAEPAVAEEAVIIPPSGGILDPSGNALLIGAVSVVLILGLVGAGIWNTRRRR